MPNKIEKEIISQKIIKDNSLPKLTESLLEREEIIFGCTTKIKPCNEHAIYITINFQEVKGLKIPFEIFINSKDTANYQWITVLTRTLSAIFRERMDSLFILREMQNTYSPVGGYFYKNSKTGKSEYIPSVVAHIGKVIEEVLKNNV